MQREFIFRFYDKSEKKMRRFNFSEMCYKGIWDLFPTVKEFYPDELMQYTGLKDKNGKEIYEGDVIIFLHKSWIGDKGTLAKWEVYWHDGGFSYGDKKEGFAMSVYQAWASIVEIIGNIYENPEFQREYNKEKV